MTNHSMFNAALFVLTLDAIDTRAFPGIRPYGYWTDTEYVPNPAGAWGVIFYDGYTFAVSKNVNYFVRLVRSGQ